MNDDMPPFWKVFPQLQPEDIRWIEPGQYPFDAWVDFVKQKPPEEKESYFIRWEAPQTWRFFFSEAWQRLLYPEKYDEEE